MQNITVSRSKLLNSFCSGRALYRLNKGVGRDPYIVTIYLVCQRTAQVEAGTYAPCDKCFHLHSGAVPVAMLAERMVITTHHYSHPFRDALQTVFERATISYRAESASRR